MKRLITLAALVILTGAVGFVACGEEDNCLVDQENCRTAYIEATYGDDRTCCSGLTCESSPLTGNLICR